jgi:hypothetical protein
MTNTTIVNHETTASFCPEAMGFECTVSPISYVNGIPSTAVGMRLQQHSVETHPRPPEDARSISERWGWVLESRLFSLLERLLVEDVLVRNYHFLGEDSLDDWLNWQDKYELQQELWKHLAEVWPSLPCDFAFFCCDQVLVRLYEGKYTHLFAEVDSDANWKDEGF